MKKILMSLLMTSALLPAIAQKMDAAKIPAEVKKSFEKKYPGVIGKWEKEGGNYEVNFDQNSTAMSVLIDPAGAIVETEMNIKVTALPGTINVYVREHYKGHNIKEASKITRGDGTVNYEAEVAGTDVIFDANGKFLKEVKEEKKD